MENNEENKAIQRLFLTIFIVVKVFVLVSLILYNSFRTKPQKPHIDKISPAYKMIENVEANGDTTDILTFYPDKL